jgi:hypothetical protein
MHGQSLATIAPRVDRYSQSGNLDASCAIRAPGRPSGSTPASRRAHRYAEIEGFRSHDCTVASANSTQLGGELNEINASVRDFRRGVTGWQYGRVRAGDTSGTRVATKTHNADAATVRR